MLICELAFDQPDPENPKYSHLEVDHYAWINATPEMPSHRLSLRKNLETGKFEVYRRFNKRQVISLPSFIFITHEDMTGIDAVAFEGDFKSALEFGDNEYEKWHGKEHERDKPCEHQYPNQAMDCQMKANLKERR